MITSINNTVSFLKNLFIETFLNNTNKVSVVSDTSVLNATAFGVGKIAQKCLKETAIVESQIFPESAAGEYLDRAASLYGVTPRRGALSSSTYIRVRCSDETTFYSVDDPNGPTETISFKNMNGIVFNIKQTTTITNSGNSAIFWGYIPVESTTQGSISNVQPNTILSCVNAPASFIECTNEYMAIGGRDEEDDETFRIRIMNNLNSLSITTLEYITQVLQTLDNNILRVLYSAYSSESGIILYIATQNGSLYTDIELLALRDKLAPYMSLQTYSKQGYPNLVLKNISWTNVSIDFRVSFSDTSTSAIQTSVYNMQVNLSKYLDFRFWQNGQSVVWDNLLQIIKSDDNVVLVPNTHFTPNVDIAVAGQTLPRISSFIVRDLNGDIYLQSDFTPIFYSNIQATNINE